MTPASTLSGDWRVEYLTSQWVHANFHEDRSRALGFYTLMCGPDWAGVKALRLYCGDVLVRQTTKHNFTE